MVRARAIVLGLVGCGHATPAPVPVTSPPVVTAVPVDAGPVARTYPAFPELAKADFVMSLHDGALAAFALTGDKVTEVGRVQLIPAADAEDAYGFGVPLEWLDRDHLMVRSGDVLIISPTTTVVLPTPDDKLFDQIPKPEQHDGDGGIEMSRGGGDSGAPVIAANKTIWWTTCVWGLPVDGFQCEVFGRTRIWPPDPNHKVEVGGTVESRFQPHAREHGWTDAKPGFALGKPTDHNMPTCKPAKGKPIVLDTPREQSKEWVDNHWLPATPPLLAVEYGEFGLADAIPEVFAVYDACTAKPVLVGASLELLADGLWISDDYPPGTKDADSETKTVAHLRRGLTVLGELPARRAIALRPEK